MWKRLISLLSVALCVHCITVYLQAMGEAWLSWSIWVPYHFLCILVQLFPLIFYMKVTFIYHLAWIRGCPDMWINITSECFYMKSTFEWVNLVGCFSWYDVHHSICCKFTKIKRKKEFPHHFLPLCLTLNLEHLILPCSQREINSFGFLDSGLKA